MFRMLMVRGKLIRAALGLCLAAMSAGGALAADTGDAHAARRGYYMEVDVAEDGSKFVFGEPVDENGLPKYGAIFLTQGYIYPAGVLSGENGIKPGSGPEFEAMVIGKWTCRGWFVKDFAQVLAEGGKMVVTTQVFEFEQNGQTTIVTDGFELADISEAIARAVTGGTGRYNGVTGQQVQTFLGMNQSEGVNLRVRFRLRRR